MTEVSAVERLHAMFLKAGFSNEEIKSGMRLTSAGLHKVAARLGLSPEEVPALVNKLAAKVRDEMHDMDNILTPVTEAGAGKRFSYEGDILGNITVRDAQTGRDAFLQGNEAAKLRDLLRKSPDDQPVLARFAHLLEDGVVLDEEDGYEDEIRSDVGTYNFPWRGAGQHGTATASYRGKGRDLKLDLLDVRDNQGESIEPDDDLNADILQQARDFIGEE